MQEQGHPAQPHLHCGHTSRKSELYWGKQLLPVRNVAPQKAALPPPKQCEGVGMAGSTGPACSPHTFPWALQASFSSRSKGKRESHLHIPSAWERSPHKSLWTVVGVSIPAARASPLPVCLIPYPTCHSPSSPSLPSQSLWHKVMVRPSHSQNTGNSGSMKTVWKEWMSCTSSPRP